MIRQTDRLIDVFLCLCALVRVPASASASVWTCKYEWTNNAKESEKQRHESCIFRVADVMTKVMTLPMHEAFIIVLVMSAACIYSYVLFNGDNLACSDSMAVNKVQSSVYARTEVNFVCPTHTFVGFNTRHTRILRSTAFLPP